MFAEIKYDGERVQVCILIFFCCCWHSMSGPVNFFYADQSFVDVEGSQEWQRLSVFQPKP